MPRLGSLVAAACLMAPASGCRNGRPTPSDAAGRAGEGLAVAPTVPVIVEPTVIAFWLRGTDTLPTAESQKIRADFLQRGNAVGEYLADTDVRFLRAESDTVVVQLAGGVQRTIMLSGLDFPYGFVLIDPGYAEEFHTGLDLLADLEDAIADYFGLGEDRREARPKHRIAFWSGS